VTQYRLGIGSPATVFWDVTHILIGVVTS